MTRAFNIRIIFRTMGALLLIETLFMALAMGVSLWYDEPDDTAFIVSTVITLIAGLLGLWGGRNASNHVGEREGYVIVAFVWIVFSAFGMLPYYLSGAIPTITDAWFETMSGFSTTGATCLRDVEALTHGLHFWRCLSQWVGGLGIIVLCLALLPMFGLGGMQLYAAEVTGLNYEKISPRIADTAKHLWAFYILLTVSEAILLCIFGMGKFDAICHAMTTIATGGFSTHNDSVMSFGPAIQYTIAIYTLISGINFGLLIFALRGKPHRLWRDEETQWYLGATLLCTIGLTLGLSLHYGWNWSGVEQAFRHGFFMVTNAITSTGFAATDYMLWPTALWTLLFFMMFTGGASGSTAGGIKWVRILIFAKSAISEVKRRIHPNAIIPIKLNNRPLTHETISNVMAFMMFYISIIVVTVIIFTMTGVGFDEAVGVAVCTIGNVGAAIGEYGPAGSYADFPTLAKWWMTFVMLIGRLEIFTILLLFTPALWKK